MTSYKEMLPFIQTSQFVGCLILVMKEICPNTQITKDEITYLAGKSDNYLRKHNLGVIEWSNFDCFVEGWKIFNGDIRTGTELNKYSDAYRRTEYYLTNSMPTKAREGLCEFLRQYLLDRKRINEEQ